MNRKELSDKVDKFVAKYQGKEKGYPTDSSYKGECLSIVKLYIQEVFGINAPPSGSNSAYGYWTNFPNPLPNLFDKVQNTLTGVPEKGDIPIWNTSVGGGFGHIAVFVSGDVNAFNSFDQNWLGRQVHLQPHDYNNVVGWLRPKLESQTPPEPPRQPIITDQTKIPQIVDENGNPMEVQTIRSKIRDMTKALENAAENATLRIKEEVEKARAEERRNCEEQVKEKVNEVKIDYQDRLSKANLKYESLLLKKSKDISFLSLFWIRIKKLFVRAGK